MSSFEKGATSIPCIIIYCQPERKAQGGDAFCLLPWMQQRRGFGSFRLGKYAGTCSLRLERCRLHPGYLQGQETGLVPQRKRDRHCNCADQTHNPLTSGSCALLTLGIEFCREGRRGHGFCVSVNNEAPFKKKRKSAQ